MVDDPIPERRGRDDALFGFVNLEVAVGSGAIAAVFQFFGEVHAFQFPLGKESCRRGETAFATHGEVRGLHQVAEAGDLLPEILVGLGHLMVMGLVLAKRRHDS